MAKSKRADGRYAVSIELGRDPETGKRHRKTFYGATIKEANAKKRAYEVMMDHGIVPDTHDMTVVEWAKKYRDIYVARLAYMSQVTANPAVDKIEQYFGATLLRNIRSSDIQKFADTFTNGSYSMISRQNGITKSFFAYAVDERIIEYNPALNVQWPHGTKGTHRALEQAEIRAINDTWRDYPVMGSMAMIMLYTGLRRGEVAALTWRDVDMAKGIIHVHRSAHFEDNATIINDHPKTDAGIRDVPIPAQLRPVFDALPRSLTTIFARSDGRPLNLHTLFAPWNKYAAAVRDAANLPDMPLIRMHDLRHTYATMLYDAGIDIKGAQHLLGHASPEMTMQIYTHLTATHEAANIDRLNAYISAL